MARKFGRIDAYKRHCFVLEAKQGSDADRKAAKQGESDFFGQPAREIKRGTAKRGTPAWSEAMVEARAGRTLCQGAADRSRMAALPADNRCRPLHRCLCGFQRHGKQYTQFPDAARFRIKLDDLRRRRPHPACDDLDRPAQPRSVKGSRESHPQIAGHLAELSKRFETREKIPPACRFPDAMPVHDVCRGCEVDPGRQLHGLP